MDFPYSFGDWIKRRRQELRLTQAEVAERASCTVFTVRKIEAEQRRPSKQVAGLLALALEIPPDLHPTFIKTARGELSIEKLPSPDRGLSPHSPPASSSPLVPGNLPRALTPFIGREPELSSLNQLLRDPGCSLLTLIGPGGIGKTRLAIETARQAQELFPDGIWFVPLTSLNSPVLIVPAIAEAVGLKIQDPANPQAQLLRYLGSKRALLIFDNAEHLLDGVGVFTEILKDCQQVKLLVTSRERLNLLSEWLFEIQGLPFPPDDHAQHFKAYSSVALFFQSARRVQAGFEIQQDERRWVLQICKFMEGMPLGIELSAAWAGLLSCEEIAKEIKHNLDFLSVSMRDLPERHRSLRATLEHSWKLLNAEERLILRRFSVFHGSFSREAAQEICAASLAVLSSLRNKTLLYRNDQGFYSLHEFIRQYAELKLSEEPGECERIKDQHALYYVQRLAEWEKALKSSRQVETFNKMAQVIDNLSQGWRHLITTCQPGTGKRNPFCADLLPHALFSLSLFYEMRCRSLEAIALLKESVEYLQAVQGEFEETEDRSRFLSVLGQVTAYLGLHHIYILQYAKARVHLEDAIHMLENSQHRVAKAQAQVMLAGAILTLGHLQEAAALLEQCREVFREEGQDWWYALATINLATSYISLGKLEQSEALYQEGFHLVEPGDFRLALPLRGGFAYILNLQKDYIRAEQMQLENLQLSYQYGNYRLTAQILFELGRVALATHRIELAEENIQKSINHLVEYGEPDDLAMHRLYLGKCFAARRDLPAARDQFRQVIQNGQTFDQFFLVYWGLVNIARTYLDEGQAEKALEISLALRRRPIEFQRIQDENDRLLADLQAALPGWQVKAAMERVNGQLTPDQVLASALAYAQAQETA